MRDVDAVSEVKAMTDYYMDTGVPHYVVIVTRYNYNDSVRLSGLDVVKEGRAIRYSDAFKERGTNVNFVEYADLVTPPLTLHIRARTYERGVEDETLSCGSGMKITTHAHFSRTLTLSHSHAHVHSSSHSHTHHHDTHTHPTRTCSLSLTLQVLPLQL